MAKTEDKMFFLREKASRFPTRFVQQVPDARVKN